MASVEEDSIKSVALVKFQRKMSSKVPEKRSYDESVLATVNGAAEVEPLTSEALTKYVDWLERASLINREHRTKYADDPEKYRFHPYKLINLNT